MSVENVADINAKAMAEFRKQLEALPASFEESAKRIVNRFCATGLAETKQETPVGHYDYKENRKGKKQLAVARKNAAAARDRVAANAEKVKQGKNSVTYKIKDGRTLTFTTYKMIGGTLKRGWYRDSAQRMGNSMVGSWSNNTSYAMYVNDGHRVVRNKKTVGFAPGKHFLEKGIRAAEKALPSLLDAEIKRIKGETGF